MQGLLDIVEVDDHAALIERLGAELNLHFRVVPMQEPALAVVIEQAMAVAEMDFFGDGVHKLIIGGFK